MAENAKHLLLVDDEAALREAIAERLADHGFVVEQAGSGEEALARLADFAFDIIVTDLRLPGVDGTAVIEAAVARYPEIIAIVVTGYGTVKDAVDAIRRGATDYVVKFGDYLFTIPLVIEKNLTVAKMIKEREELRRELEQKNVQLEQMASTDPLTTLYNRRYFSRVLDQMFAESQRHDHDLACVMIDLDQYKKLNDTYGHQMGDELLICAGKVISANMRRMDVGARYGGDEFVLLLPHATAQEAAAAATRIRDEFRVASAVILKNNVGVSMSIGVATAKTQGAASAEQLVAHADSALYRAKEAGRNRVTVAEGTSVMAA
jgi:diguanylate cyclase (GGDEF)-like protein